MEDKELLDKIFELRTERKELRETEQELIREYNKTFGIAELPQRAYEPRNHTLSPDETVKLGEFLSKPRKPGEIISMVNYLLEKRKQ